MGKLKWYWDYDKKCLFASSRFHDDGDPFWYYIKQLPSRYGYPVFELSGTAELVPKSKMLFTLAGAIRAANKIEEGT